MNSKFVINIIAENSTVAYFTTRGFKTLDHSKCTSRVLEFYDIKRMQNIFDEMNSKKIVRMSADPAMCDLFSSPRAAYGPSSKCAARRIISTPLVMSFLISLHQDFEDSPIRSLPLSKKKKLP